MLHASKTAHSYNYNKPEVEALNILFPWFIPFYVVAANDDTVKYY